MKTMKKEEVEEEYEDEHEEEEDEKKKKKKTHNINVFQHSQQYSGNTLSSGLRDHSWRVLTITQLINFKSGLAVFKSITAHSKFL